MLSGPALACARTLERRAPDGAWAPVRRLPADVVTAGGLRLTAVCTMPPRVLLPGADDTLRVEVPADLGPGTYRLVFPDVPADPRRGTAGPPLVSPSFRLR